MALVDTLHSQITSVMTVCNENNIAEKKKIALNTEQAKTVEYLGEPDTFINALAKAIVDNLEIKMKARMDLLESDFDTLVATMGTFIISGPSPVTVPAATVLTPVMAPLQAQRAALKIEENVPNERGKVAQVK
jgi:hypothetical protein